MTRLLKILLGLALGVPMLAAGQAPQSEARPVAIVSDAQGEAFVMANPGPVRLTLLRELQPGQVLRLDPKQGDRSVPAGRRFTAFGAAGSGSAKAISARRSNPPRNAASLVAARGEASDVWGRDRGAARYRTPC
jgi:hypothetical protein